MASEYRNNRFYAQTGINNSYGFNCIRTGSFRSSNKLSNSVNNRYSSAVKSNDQNNISTKQYYSTTKSFSSKIAKSTDTNKLMGQPKAINSFNNSSNSKLKKQQSTSSGTSSVESITPKYNGFSCSGSTKRVYSSMRITKKEFPYMTPLANRTNVMDLSIVNNNKKNSNSNNNNNTTTTTNNNNNEIMNDKSFDLKRNKHFYASTRSGASYSTKYPNGLPFEDEFYHRKRQNSVSSTSKSELSDYGSIDNDSDQSLLPFEDEYSHNRPSTEALYVDFSKPINSFNSFTSKSTTTTTKTTIATKTKLNSHLNGSHSSYCSSQSGNSLSKSKPFNHYDYSCKNYVCNPDEVVVLDQPVVYVAVQLCSSQKDSNYRDSKRTDIV